MCTHGVATFPICTALNIVNKLHLYQRYTYIFLSASSGVQRK